jgi:hypothetical protein
MIISWWVGVKASGSWFQGRLEQRSRSERMKINKRDQAQKTEAIVPEETGTVSTTDGNSIPRSVFPIYSQNADSERERAGAGCGCEGAQTTGWGRGWGSGTRGVCGPGITRWSAPPPRQRLPLIGVPGRRWSLSSSAAVRLRSWLGREACRARPGAGLVLMVGLRNVHGDRAVQEDHHVGLLAACRRRAWL